MKDLLFGAAVVLFASTAALPVAMLPAYAQGTEWEYVGGAHSLDDLYLHEDAMLWAGGGDSILRMPSGGDEWTFVEDGDGAQTLVVTEAGTLLRNRGSSIQRSTDGGETFETVYPAATFKTPLYRIRAGPYTGYICIGQAAEDISGAAFSADDGLSWTEGPIAPDKPFGNPTVYFLIPDTPGGDEEHTHRILAGAINGIAYSDDGGASWTLSKLWQTLGYEAFTFARTTSGPLAGRLYAGVADTSFGRLYYSDDGGHTWTPQREFGGQRFYFVEGADGSVGPTAQANPDGTLLVIGLADGATWRSDDGGATWQRTALPTLDEASGDTGISVDDALLDAEGRLNVAAGTAGSTSEPDGLYRASFPAVSAEGGPEPGKPGVEVTVYPNPASSAATVALTVPERAEVSVVVYDVLRRTVAVLHEGPVETGARRFTLSGRTLPAGVYLVRAEVSGPGGDARVLTARLTHVN